MCSPEYAGGVGDARRGRRWPESMEAPRRTRGRRQRQWAAWHGGAASGSDVGERRFDSSRSGASIRRGAARRQGGTAALRRLRRRGFGVRLCVGDELPDLGKSCI